MKYLIMRKFNVLLLLFPCIICFSTTATSLSVNSSILQLMNQDYLKTVKFLSKFQVLGAQNLKIDEEKSEVCLSKLESLMTLKTPESLAFIDAAGKPLAGITSGNLIWIGNYEMCQTLRNITKKNYRNCKVTASLSLAGVTLPNAVKWTGCLPPQCLNGNLDGALIKIGNWLSEKSNGSISFNSEKWSVECSHDLKLDTGAKFGLGVLSTLGLLVAGGTLYHLLKPLVLSFYEEGETENIELLQTSGGESNQDREDKGCNLEKSVEYAALNNHLVFQILSCFALQRTIRELTSTKTKPDQLLCLNGIRVISKNWIILGHIIFYMFNEVSDISYLTVLLKRRSFAMIVNAYPSVDSFFVLSGFIVTLVLLKKLRKSGMFTWKKWGVFYLHRYVRLTAPYAVMLLVNGFLYRQWVHGPLSLDMNRASSHEVCKEYWYTYLLYLNNIVPWVPKHHASCFGGSWFMANAMQFFIICPIFVVLLFRKPLLGVFTIIAIVTTSSVAAASITAYLNLGPTMILGTSLNYILLYRVPWIRVMAFLIGILGGWFYWIVGDELIQKVQALKAWKKFLLAAPMWLCTAVIQYAVVFGLHQELMTAIEEGKEPTTRAATEAVSVAYQLLSRVAWSVCLIIQILLCQYGLGGPINSVLSWSGWLVMSKLTYSVYLVHVGLLGVLMAQMKHPFYLEPDFEFVFFYFGFTVMSYLIAAVLYISVEQPVAFLECLIFTKDQ